MSGTVSMPMEIALLVKMLPIERGAELIEQFGSTRASEGKIEATTDAYNHIDNLLAAGMARAKGG